MGFAMKKVVAGFRLIMLSAVANAGVNDEPLVRKLLDDFSISTMIEEIPQIIQDGLEQRRRETGDQFIKIRSIFNKLFSAENIHAKVVEALNHKFNETHYKSVEKVLTTPEAKTLINIKQKSTTPEALKAIRELAQQHEDFPLSEHRLDLLQKFDEASAETEFFIATQALSVNAILQAMNVVKGTPATHHEDKDKLLQVMYEQFQRPSKFTTMMTFRYIFRDSTDEEVERYIGIYRTRSVRWFLGETMQALKSVMLELTDEAVARLKAESN
jgi:hypothetical protein